MNKKKITALLMSLTLAVSITACSSSNNKASSDTSTSQITTESSSEVEEVDKTDEAETIVDEADIVKINLGDSISIDGEGATAEGSIVNITKSGTYRISGTLTNGQIDVNTSGKVTLQLDGVTITNSQGPAIMVTDAKKITVTLLENTINSLADGDSNNENDAALFTNDTLVVNGEGTLNVTGNNNEGISSDDDIIINSGIINVTALDDGLNAHDDITINGGEIFVNVNGGDGIDSNGTIHITGGNIISLGSIVQGNEGVDTNGNDMFTITGGTVIATGIGATAPSSDSTQASLYFDLNSTQAQGTKFTIELDGKEIVSYAPERTYQALYYSSDILTEGATYDTSVDRGTSITSIAAIVPEGAGMMSGGPGQKSGK
ncbi:MAG: carbohydrate-binding domain-containing protein [Clostridiaceae bacterium]